MKDYDPRTFALDTPRGAHPAERKSPPLDELEPQAAQYRRFGPEPYWSRHWLDVERERLWSRTWLCAGLLADLARPGDFLRFDVGNESVVVLRAHDGSLRAFHNVCRHRGMPLVAEAAGHVPRFVCRYHSWTYDLSGRCTHVTDRAQFSPEALEGPLDLAAVRVEPWGAFVFVCLDPHAPALADHLGPVAETLAAYRIEDMHVVKDVIVDMECNWKLSVHINQEAYHFHRVHREALPYADDLRQQIDFFPGGHNRFMTATGIPSPRLGPATVVSAEQQHLLREAGIDPASFAGGPDGVRRALQEAKRRPDNPFGLDYSRFSDNQLTDDWSYSIFPNMSLNAHPEGVLFMRYLPHRSDPERSEFHVMILVPRLPRGVRPPGYMGVDEAADCSGRTRASRERRSMAAPGLGWALDQDCAVLRALQSGVRSAAAGSLRLSEHEARIRHFWTEYARRTG
jgi:phenylpropionate dioxygenase-like ring-hydroxylating dioxygenase large terminal subunit